MSDLLIQRVIKPILKLATLDAIRNPKPKVAVIRLAGIIGAGGRGRNKGMSHEDYADVIKAAFETPSVKAVALVINSPGGSPVQSALIHEAIRIHAEEKDLPVYAFAEDLCASGGYWLALAGDEIYAHPASIVGSIGVVSAGFGLAEFISRHGIERRVYAQGENKAMLDPFLPEKQDDIDRLLNVQRDVHAGFKDLVKTRRQKKLNADSDELFSGAFWSGKQAFDMGLVDGLGSAQAVLREKFGENVNLVEFKPKKSMLSGLFSSSIGLADLPETALHVMDERLERQRFGL